MHTIGHHKHKPLALVLPFAGVPLFNREPKIVIIRHNWKERRVCFHDDHAQVDVPFLLANEVGS